MEEDVLGPRQTLGQRYTACTRCGQMMPRRVVHAQEAGLLDGTRSAVAELCADCEKIALSESPPVETDE
jgi:hypothetical protein